MSPESMFWFLVQQVVEAEHRERLLTHLGITDKTADSPARTRERLRNWFKQYGPKDGAP